MKQSKILIADDIEQKSEGDTRSKHIQQIAFELAKRMKKKVDLLYVEDIKNTSYMDYTYEVQKQHLSILKKIKNLNKNVSTHLKVGSPSQEIIKFIQKNSPELVIMATQKKKFLEKLFLGSVTEEVLRNSKKPVLTLGPQTKEINLKLPKSPKILLATDLTKTSAHAEKYAMKIAKQLNAQVTIFYSEWEQIKHLQETMYATGLPVVLLEDPTDGTKKYVSKQLKKKKQSYEKNKTSCNYIISDYAIPLSQLILKEAAKDYSIIVMGTQNRNKLVKNFLGSNARKVILGSPIPVIVVRS